MVSIVARSAVIPIPARNDRRGVKKRSYGSASVNTRTQDTSMAVAKHGKLRASIDPKTRIVLSSDLVQKKVK